VGFGRRVAGLVLAQWHPLALALGAGAGYIVLQLLPPLFIRDAMSIIAGKHGPQFAVHKAATVAAVLLVGGHLYMAVLNPSTRPALRGILTG